MNLFIHLYWRKLLLHINLTIRVQHKGSEEIVGNHVDNNISSIYFTTFEVIR